MIQAQNIPQELKALPNWVCWRVIEREGKLTKVPYIPGTDKLADVSDPSTWRVFKEALADTSANGVGFVFTPALPYCGVDLDHCYAEEGKLQEWANEVISLLNSYAERSPSGKGVHIIVKARILGHRRRHRGLEMYDAGRYFTFTGDVLEEGRQVEVRQKEVDLLYEKTFGTPQVDQLSKQPEGKLSEEEIRQILELALGAENGLKFGKLWNGDTSEYSSQSEADAALCSMLSFWVAGDATRIDQLFRRSGLMRPKWDERPDYRKRTIEGAQETTSESYSPRGGLLTEGADDEGNAQCVKALFGDRVLHCDAFGWLVHAGTHWEHESSDDAVTRMAVETLKRRRSAAINAEGEQEPIVKAARPSDSHIRGCLHLLQSLVPASPDEFDAEADLLNCKNGVLNLRTGILSNHLPSDRFTYCLPTEYLKDADSSTWVDWLKKVIKDESHEVLDFLQMAVGYSLTGHTREEVMFYIWGPPRGGKGTFTETLIYLLGGEPLAKEVDMDTFTEKRHGGDQGFDLASMKATRLIIASESKEAHWLDGPRLKRWTGGNLVHCAHKYRGFFSYRPQFKIWLISNFPLQLEADDAAAWTRPQVIEFPNSWVGREDKTLKERFRQPEMLRGVLAWAAEGALKWYALPSSGLRAPQEVVEATAAARDELDWISRWIEEEIEITENPSDYLPNEDLYTSYSVWCKERGAPAKKLIALNRALKMRGYRVGELLFREGKSRRCWVGAKLAGSTGAFSRLADTISEEVKDDAN